jgi:hypothetical protein
MLNFILIPSNEESLSKLKTLIAYKLQEQVITSTTILSASLFASKNLFHRQWRGM